MKKRIALLLAVVILAMAILAACGAERGVGSEASDETSDGEEKSGEISGEAKNGEAESESLPPFEPADPIGEDTDAEISGGSGEPTANPTGESDNGAELPASSVPISPSESASPQPDITATPEATPTMAEIIDANIGIIIGDASWRVIMHESVLIDAHHDEFAEIVAFGETALPYLENAFRVGGDNWTDSDYYYLYGVIACAAAYAIKPELYDIMSVSPNGKYMLKAPAYSFIGIYGTGSAGVEYNIIHLIDRATGSTIWSGDVNASGFPSWPRVMMYWTSDSRYAAIAHYYYRLNGAVDVLDVKTLEYIAMPGSNELKELVTAEDKAFFDFIYEGFEWYTFLGWETDEQIRINYRFVDQELFDFENWYTYDLASKEIVGFHYEVERFEDYNNQTEMAPAHYRWEPFLSNVGNQLVMTM